MERLLDIAARELDIDRIEIRRPDVLLDLAEGEGEEAAVAQPLLVEVGVVLADLGLEAGTYLALLSHSGSRGTGNLIASHYSKLAARLHPELPDELMHLAWLDLDGAEGQEYWAAMELMGRYAAASHELIHRYVLENLGATPLAEVENHHNFAWLEEHRGQRLVVHRKGATPAGEGVLGVIPGSMGDPAYVVRGLGSAESLCSASHGAGRLMSRKKGKDTFNFRAVRGDLPVGICRAEAARGGQADDRDPRRHPDRALFLQKGGLR